MIQGSLYENAFWTRSSPSKKPLPLRPVPRSQDEAIDYPSEITVFPSLFETSSAKYMKVTEIVARIKNGNSRELVTRIRKGESHLKKQLPCLCWSGLFTQRCNSGLIKHSGLVCLDYDNVRDLTGFKKRLCRNSFTYACFVSPSGTGLKVIVKGTDPRQALKYFPSEYLDLQTDASRVCFESWDENIYFNVDSDILKQ